MFDFHFHSWKDQWYKIKGPSLTDQIWSQKLFKVKIMEGVWVQSQTFTQVEVDFSTSKKLLTWVCCVGDLTETPSMILTPNNF